MHAAQTGGCCDRFADDARLGRARDRGTAQPEGQEVELIATGPLEGCWGGQDSAPHEAAVEAAKELSVLALTQVQLVQALDPLGAACSPSLPSPGTHSLALGGNWLS